MGSGGLLPGKRAFGVKNGKLTQEVFSQFVEYSDLVGDEG